MESETQETNISSDFDLGSDASPTETLTAASPSKRKSKKKDQGSDVAFFACFPCLVIAAVAIVMSIIGFLPIGFVGEFCASLRAQYILVLLICALPALFAPQVRIPMVAACGVFALINICLVVPCMFPKAEPAGDKQNLKFLKFRIMQLSIDDPATKLEPIFDEITRVHPDIVCVTGVPPSSLIKLNELVPPHFMHRESFMRDDGYAHCIYSTVALKGSRFKKVGPEKLPVLLTTLQFDYGWFRIIMVKVPEPTDNQSVEKRNEQLKAISSVVKELNGRKIVLGNFNMTPYSMAFGDFVKEAELIDTRIGVQPNYNLGPVDFMGLLRIPYDHMFVNKSVAVLNRYVCQPVGLTHRPLLGDFYPADSEAVPYTDEPAEPEPQAAPKAEKPKEEQPKAAEEKKPVRNKRKAR